MPVVLLWSTMEYVSAQKFVAVDDLVVAVPAKYPPYYSLDRSGQPVGFAIDVFEAVAARAGLRFHYDVKSSWRDVIQSLEEGVSDIIPNMGITQNPTEFIDFTSPVITFPISLFVRKSNQQINNI